MTAYSKLQQEEFAAQELGYRAVTHQRFVGTGYFDEIAQVVSSGNSSTTALAGSTEAEQFHGAVPAAPGTDTRQKHTPDYRHVQKNPHGAGFIPALFIWKNGFVPGRSLTLSPWRN